MYNCTRCPKIIDPALLMTNVFPEGELNPRLLNEYKNLEEIFLIFHLCAEISDST